MEIRKLNELNLKQKKVFLRLDLNVPMKEGTITDETRITQALPTIKYILERTNHLVIASHLGRPKGKKDKKYTLEPVGKKLAELLNKEVVFVENYIEEDVSPILKELKDHQFVLYENLRFYPEEEANDIGFARKLINNFEIYVNDAFGTLHRAHASVAAVTEFIPPHMRAAGFLLQKEIEAFKPLLENPQSPFTVVMGGAKVSDKIGVILNLLTKCNNLLIGGAMAYTFLKYKGINTGSSKIEEDKMNLIESIYLNAEKRRVNIELPLDHVCAKEFAETSTPINIDNQEIPADLIGLDIGPKTIQKYSMIISNSKTVFWNGPMGVFEWPAFANGTISIAKAMSECKGFTVIGGGDSVSAVNKAKVTDKIYHISTGGGASLELLEGRVLPGLKVLYKT